MKLTDLLKKGELSRLAEAVSLATVATNATVQSLNTLSVAKVATVATIPIDFKTLKRPITQIKLQSERKFALHKGRLEVLRILLRRFLNNAKCQAMVNYKGKTLINNKAVEDYLDMELVNFDYDLEAIIDMYRLYTPEPITEVICRTCGYRPLFCICDNRKPTSE